MMTMTAEVVKVSDDLVVIEQNVRALVVSDSESFNTAAETIALLKRMASLVEDHRTEEVAPLNKQVKEINARYKAISSKIDPLVEMLNRSMGAYRQRVIAEEEAKRREEEKIRRKAEEAARKAAEQGKPLPPPPPPPPPVIGQPKAAATTFGTVSMRSEWKWELVDLDKVPRKYLVLNEALLTKLVRAGERSIAGVRIYEEFNSQLRK